MKQKSQIQVLEGLEAVRRRPGMYIGGTDERAYHHLFAEILDNSMDEAVAGHANWIAVHLDADLTEDAVDDPHGDRVVGALEDFERRDMKIPFFGDIPLVGPLFRSNRETARKTELAVRAALGAGGRVVVPVLIQQAIDNGIVVIDPHRCIGCGYCMAACPYDARYVHPEGYADKCTFCMHRVEKGMQPAPAASRTSSSSASIQRLSIAIRANSPRSFENDDRCFTTKSPASS